MYNKNILTFCLIAVLFLSAFKIAQAADLRQHFSSVLATWARVVVAAGGVVNTTIDCDTGDLATALTPRFWFATNQSGTGTTNWSMSATIQDSGANTVNAMYGTAANPSIILANTTTPPTLAAINDIKNGTLTSNANAIAYATPATLALGSGTLNITQNFYRDTGSTDYYRIVSRSRGYRYITLTIGPGVRTGTFSALDTPGDYQAVVTFQFGQP